MAEPEADPQAVPDGDRARALAALESLLAAPPLPVGTPEELKRELAEIMDEEIGL